MNIPHIFAQILEHEEPEATLGTYDRLFPNIMSSSGRKYVAKIGTHNETEKYVGEAESLKAIHVAAPGLAPRLIACGIIDEHTAESEHEIGRPYFVSDYYDISSISDSSARVLAKRLATEVHEYKSTVGFGFPVPTFCGPTRLDNGWFATWAECFDSLIAGLLSQLKSRRSRVTELCEKGELIRQRVIPVLLGNLIVQPVLLHGDLWTGNMGTARSTGQPIIFDPSSLFGHNEADLAITRIFGNMPPSFFATYHRYLPKSEPVDQYDLRGELYELFHYLNHALIFQGSYSTTASRVMDKLLRAFPAM